MDMGKVLSKDIAEEIRHWHYESIDSTNEAALRLIAEGSVDRAIISADAQSRGRGQYGRTFYSPPQGLYLSYIWGPDHQLVADLLPVLKVALGTSRALERLYVQYEKQGAPKLEIKPLNDILYEGKKIAGILCESYRGHFIAGIGLNLYPQTFPEELRARAGYLLSSTEKIDSSFIPELFRQLEELLFQALSDSDLQEFSQRQHSP